MALLLRFPLENAKKIHEPNFASAEFIELAYYQVIPPHYDSILANATIVTVRGNDEVWRSAVSRGDDQWSQ